MVFPDCQLAGCFTPGPAAGLRKAALSISMQAGEARAACAQGRMAGKRQQMEKAIISLFSRQGEQALQDQGCSLERGRTPLLESKAPGKGKQLPAKRPHRSAQGARHEELWLPGAC